MLRSMNSLLDYRIQGTDEGVGEVHDFYFDDSSWKTRYLVVDTGEFLPGRKVLIPSTALEGADYKTGTFSVNITREQIEQSPGIDTDRPVSRQQEIVLHEYFRWVPYWVPSGVAVGSPPMAVPVEMAASDAPASAEERGDPHLRSFREVKNYRIDAVDGEIGHIDDFILDDASWHMQMAVIDTRNWLPGRHVVIATDWIERFDVHERQAHVELQRDVIEGAPVFDPSEPVNQDLAMQLYDYYGRPVTPRR